MSTLPAWASSVNIIKQKVSCGGITTMWSILSLGIVPISKRSTTSSCSSRRTRRLSSSSYPLLMHVLCVIQGILLVVVEMHVLIMYDWCLKRIPKDDWEWKICQHITDHSTMHARKNLQRGFVQHNHMIRHDSIMENALRISLRSPVRGLETRMS